LISIEFKPEVDDIYKKECGDPNEKKDRDDEGGRSRVFLEVFIKGKENLIINKPQKEIIDFQVTLMLPILGKVQCRETNLLIDERDCD